MTAAKFKPLIFSPIHGVADSCLVGLGEDPKEDTVSNNSSVVAIGDCLAMAPVLLMYLLAVAAVEPICGPFSSNACFFSL
jgi:hypothetical protein